nr:hypothetical protein [uncultured bacterium]
MGFAEDWKAWCDRPFPLDPPASSALGFELRSIDTFAAGCLDTFSERGTLDEPRIAVLERCLRDLRPLLPQVPESAGDYFNQFAELCGRALGAVGRRN